MRNNLVKKFFGSIVGIIVLFFILEILIRLANFNFELNRNQEISKKEKNSYVIVALGESTTAVAGNKQNNLLVQSTAYPVYLKKILNNSIKEKEIDVINLGIMSGNSARSIAELQKFYNKNQANLLVIMLGIKDEIDSNLSHDSFLGFNQFERYKVFRLMNLLYQQFETKIKGKNDNINVGTFNDLTEEMLPIAKQDVFLNISKQLDDEDFDYKKIIDNINTIYLANYYFNTGNLLKAEMLYKQLIEKINYGYFPLIAIHNQSEEYIKLNSLLSSYLKKNPNNTYALKEQFLLYSRTNVNNLNKYFLNKIKGKKNTDINIKLAIGAMFLLENNFKLAKKELEEICNVENVNDKTLIINKVNVKEYLRSIRYRDAIFECMFNNAYVNSKLKNNNEALKILNYYLKLNAEDAAAKELRKKVVMDLGLMNESISNDTSDLKRLGDYYLLMNTYSSRGDYVKENYLEDLMKKRFKNTILNFKKIIALAKKNKTKIIFVQYPDFKLKHLKSLLPIDEKLTFVDNESLFINNPKNTYIFEARYPYKFNHFTQEGARLLAEKIGKVAIKVIEDDLAFSKK